MQTLPAPPALAAAPRRPRLSWRAILYRAAVWMVVADAVLVVVIAGFQVRRWAWERTRSIRFTGDIQNGYYQGQRAAEVGVVAVYDREDERHEGQSNPRYSLDYTPLRLAVVTQWYRWTQRQEQFKHPENWQPDYAFNRPMLMLNAACELAAAVAAFLLVRTWLLRSRRPPLPPSSGLWALLGLPQPWPGRALQLADLPLASPAPPMRLWRANLWATIAGLLLWFDPAVIWGGHCWPQWDVWVLPFYLLAALLASLDWWLGAGVMLAIGAMLKGQTLLVAPIFVLWPLMGGAPRWALRLAAAVLIALLAFLTLPMVLSDPWLRLGLSLARWVAIIAAAALVALVLLTGRWGAALRCLSGFGLCAGMLVWPWIAQAPSARLWVGTVFLSGAILCPLPFLPRRSWIWWAGAGALTYLALGGVLWPWRAAPAWRLVAIAVPAMGIIVATLRWLPGRYMPYLLAGTMAAALALCVPLFDGSLSWYRVGFEYGTRHFPSMDKRHSNNLATLLVAKWSWSRDEEVFTLDKHDLLIWPERETPVTIRELLFAIYGTSLGLCAIGVAAHARRSDPRTLVALAAPWVLSFALLPQMHQRYFLWAAGVSAIVIAADLGMGLLHLLVSAVAWGQMAHTMLSDRPDFAPNTLRLLNGAHPEIAWLVVLCAGIFLYVAVMPRRDAGLALAGLEESHAPPPWREPFPARPSGRPQIA